MSQYWTTGRMYLCPYKFRFRKFCSLSWSWQWPPWIKVETWHVFLRCRCLSICVVDSCLNKKCGLAARRLKKCQFIVTMSRSHVRDERIIARGGAGREILVWQSLIQNLQPGCAYCINSQILVWQMPNRPYRRHPHWIQIIASLTLVNIWNRAIESTLTKFYDLQKIYISIQRM